MGSMLVQDISEFELIERLTKVVSKNSNSSRLNLKKAGGDPIISIGDDAAAWRTSTGTSVLTTDTMVEGVHFKLDYTSWRELGWKSFASNLSDIAAMGCQATYAVVTLGVRGDIEVNSLLDLYEGFNDVCRLYGGTIVGGDLVKSDSIFITVALEGISPSGDQILRRDTASAGDYIVVSGHLGCSAGGLRALGQSVYSSLPLNLKKHLINAHSCPSPRMQLGETLLANGVITAMDVSDGLLADLNKICQSSGVGAKIMASDVPVHDQLKSAFPDDWLDLAVAGGEDYELLFTADRSQIEIVRSASDVRITVIGTITQDVGELLLIDEEDKVISLNVQGWDHFLLP